MPKRTVRNIRTGKKIRLRGKLKKRRTVRSIRKKKTKKKKNKK